MEGVICLQGFRLGGAGFLNKPQNMREASHCVNTSNAAGGHGKAQRTLQEHENSQSDALLINLSSHSTVRIKSTPGNNKQLQDLDLAMWSVCDLVLQFV